MVLGGGGVSKIRSILSKSLLLRLLLLLLLLHQFAVKRGGGEKSEFLKSNFSCGFARIEQIFTLAIASSGPLLSFKIVCQEIC